MTGCRYLICTYVDTIHSFVSLLQLMNGRTDGWMDGYLRIWYTQWRSSSFNYLVIPQLFFKTPSPRQPKQWFHNIHLLHIYYENGHIWIASNCRPSSSAREWSNDGWKHGVNTSISNLLNNRWLCHINYYFWSLLSIT